MQAGAGHLLKNWSKETMMFSRWIAVAADSAARGLAKVNGKPVQFEDYVSDVHSFLKPLRAYYKSVYVVGYDWGARLALAYGIAYKGQSKGLVLISPRLMKPGVSLTQKVKSIAGMSAVTERDVAAEFDPELHVTNKEIQAALAEDKITNKELDENFLDAEYADG